MSAPRDLSTRLLRAGRHLPDRYPLPASAVGEKGTTMTTHDDAAAEATLLAADTRIREARERAALTQQGLADVLDVTQGCVSRWESGERDPGIPDLLRIAGALDIGASSLLPAEQAEESGPKCRAVKRGGIGLQCSEPEGHDKGPDGTWHKSVYARHERHEYDGGRHEVHTTETVEWEPVDHVAEATRHLMAGRRD